MNSLRAENVSKRFGSRDVLRDISCLLRSGSITGIVGANGSGKSTLAKVLSGVLRPDAGIVELSMGDSIIERADIPFHCGFVAPYLSLYDEFTPIELLELHGALHSKQFSRESINDVLVRVGLEVRGNSRVRTFSSGMRQRVALALAVSHEPAVLVLDEPSTTLDEDGRRMLSVEVLRAAERGAIVIIASNDTREIEMCHDAIRVR